MLEWTTIPVNGKVIRRPTLRRMARKLGFRWKRFRRSPRKQRVERRFRLAMEEMRSRPDLEVAYFDEAGFSTQHDARWSQAT